MLRILALLVLIVSAAHGAVSKTVTVFTDYTVTEADEFIYADTSANSIAITLPTYPTIGFRCSVLMPAGAGTVTFTGKSQSITSIGTGIQWTFLASGYQALGLGGGGGGGGGGSVTSVGATVPSVFNVTGSPVTTTGTLAITYSGTPLPVANGGTGVTNLANGQVLVGTGSGMTPATLTAGSNVTITNGAGSITIAASGGGSSAFVSTGSTTSRLPADRAADVWNVQDFGCVADGKTDGTGADNATALAAAVTAANASYVASGQPVTLSLGNGTYAFNTAVAWKSGVILQGPGCMVTKSASTYTGAMHSLITASSLTDIGFRDLTAYGVGPDRKIAGSCTDASTLGGRDSFVDLDACSNVAIERCQLYRFQNAVLLSKPTVWRINDNYINSLSSKTLAQLDAGTYTPYSFSGDPGGGIRILGERGGANQTDALHGVISSNIIICVGLDIAIDCASQSGYPIRAQVTSNYCAGTNSGVQVYTSGAAVPDPGTLTTTDRGVAIVGNTIMWTYQQGIYLRGVEGCSAVGNHITRCAIVGTFTGTSAGGILNRTPTIHTYPTSPVAHDLYNQITGNFIIDCGNPTTGVLDAGIRCDTPRGNVSGNVVARSLDRFGANLTTSNSFGICTVDLGGVSGVSDAVKGCSVMNNSIRGFGFGIQFSYASTIKDQTNLGFACRIQSNAIDTVGTGIQINTSSSGYHIYDNSVTNFTTTGIYVKNTPYSQILRNYLQGSGNGIQLASGSQASDYYVTGGRMGPTIRCDNNTINGTTTPISINETATGDVSVRGRCLTCKDNIVDGTPFNRDSTGSFTFTSAPTASDYRIWHIGDVAPMRTPTGAAQGWVCTTAGHSAPPSPPPPARPAAAQR